MTSEIPSSFSPKFNIFLTKCKHSLRNEKERFAFFQQRVLWLGYYLSSNGSRVESLVLSMAILGGGNVRRWAPVGGH
jgi:hypothetical protein